MNFGVFEKRGTQIIKRKIKAMNRGRSETVKSAKTKRGRRKRGRETEGKETKRQTYGNPTPAGVEREREKG